MFGAGSGLPGHLCVKRPGKYQTGGSLLQAAAGLEFDEATTRVFVDAVITPILQQNQMQVRLQVKIDKIQDNNSTDPTYFTANYVIYNQSDDVIGIVEAKAGGCLATESVIDCMETLRHLQANASNRLFGVITDGAHYVFRCPDNRWRVCTGATR